MRADHLDDRLLRGTERVPIHHCPRRAHMVGPVDGSDAPHVGVELRGLIALLVGDPENVAVVLLEHDGAVAVAVARGPMPGPLPADARDEPFRGIMHGGEGLLGHELRERHGRPVMVGDGCDVQLRNVPGMVVEAVDPGANGAVRRELAQVGMELAEVHVTLLPIDLDAVAPPRSAHRLRLGEEWGIAWDGRRDHRRAARVATRQGNRDADDLGLGGVPETTVLQHQRWAVPRANRSARGHRLGAVGDAGGSELSGLVPACGEAGEQPQPTGGVCSHLVGSTVAKARGQCEGRGRCHALARPDADAAPRSGDPDGARAVDGYRGIHLFRA